MQTPIAMALLQGPEHRYTLVNPGFLQTSGRNPTGKTVKEAFLPEEAHHYIPLLDEVYKTGIPYIGREIPFPRKNEKGVITYLYLDVHYHPFRSSDGTIIGVLAYILDVSDSVLARKRVEDSKFQLEELVSNLRDERVIRERFVFALSHDLRTPLTAAKISAQMLQRRGSDSEILQKASNRIIENMDRSDRMIQDLLDANRINAGETLPLSIDECDLRELAQITIEELATLHGDRFVLKASDSIRGYWSYHDLRRILENMLFQLSQFMNDGSMIVLS